MTVSWILDSRMKHLDHMEDSKAEVDSIEVDNWLVGLPRTSSCNMVVDNKGWE